MAVHWCRLKLSVSLCMESADWVQRAVTMSTWNCVRASRQRSSHTATSGNLQFTSSLWRQMIVLVISSIVRHRGWRRTTAVNNWILNSHQFISYYSPACFIIPQTIMHQLSGKIQLLVFRSKVVVICSLFNCLILTSADIFTLSNQRQRQLQQFLL